MIDEIEDLLDDEDIDELHGTITKHLEYTGSAVAERILENWQNSISQFVKVMPADYKRVMQERKRQVSAG